MNNDIQAEIYTIFDTYKSAVYGKDVSKLMSIYDTTIHAYDMWSWEFNSYPGWKAMADDWLGGLGTEKVVVSFDDIVIIGEGAMAHARAFVRFAAITEKGKELRYLENRLTWVLHYSGAWKIVHQHTSAPVDHPPLKAMLKRG